MSTTNPLGQPIGDPLPDWKGAHPPVREPIEGTRCRLEPLDADRHAAALHAAYVEDADGRNWTYLPYGPFETAEDYHGFVAYMTTLDHTHFFAIVDRSREAPVGVASYLRAEPPMGAIEVGHLSYAPALQRTPISTEAMYLMMRRVFDDWGYRRYEWKCDSLNGPSVAAAQRLGFRYEGLFRQHVVVKGRNRDTSWLAITDAEWPAIRDALEAWLDPGNFDGDGRQRRRLSDWMPPSAGVPVVRVGRGASAGAAEA
jgi:RimJ/RimL family protein N-acetyltransferase